MRTLEVQNRSDRALEKALAIVTMAESERGDVLARLVGEGVDTEIIRRLGRLNVAYGVITYSDRDWSGVTLIDRTVARRLWLVVPPDEQPLAVVLEEPDDPGLPIQRAAEEIAERIAMHYPGFLMVLHYDTAADERLGWWWKAVPLDSSGRGDFDSVSAEVHGRMVRSLLAAELIGDDSQLALQAKRY